MIIIVFGVSGCGKSTIGKQLSEKLEIPFFDADDFHPKENIKKMTNGTPLNDKDRHPWLLLLAEKLAFWSEQKGAVLACSALKEKYRKLLASQLKEKIIWVHLQGTKSLIKARIEKRNHHFMNSDLLTSQFHTLEIPDYGISVDINKKPEEIIHTIVAKI